MNKIESSWIGSFYECKKITNNQTGAGSSNGVLLSLELISVERHECTESTKSNPALILLAVIITCVGFAAVIIWANFTLNRTIRPNNQDNRIDLVSIVSKRFVQ